MFVNPFASFFGAEGLLTGFQELQKEISAYLSEEEQELIFNTVMFGAQAHAQQKRQTGEAYFTHPMAVAKILAAQRFEVKVLQAALLHDVLEDTSETYENLEKLFGKDIADIVDGVSKLDKLKAESPEKALAGSFMKILVATTNDPRVILIKLADRLHNMQTLDAMRPDKRIRISRETMDIYANLAEHLGLYYFRLQLEDLAFKHLYPWRSAVIKKHYDLRFQNHDLIKKIEKEITPELEKLGIQAKFVKRRRYLWGIYNRMLRKNSFAEALRTMPLRIITNNEDECYRVLGQVHKHYRPIEGKFFDYIAAPKKNGYQSLHTSVVREGQALNIQIRSTDMDALAELGIITLWHIKNKQYLNANHARKTTKQMQTWLSRLQEVNHLTQDPIEFYEAVKREISPKELHVYTPRGEVIDLPSGATPVDFAYAIHSYVGNHCAGAKVNGRDYPLNKALQTAQTVEIIVNPQAKPRSAWLQFVTSEKARVGINHYLKSINNEEALDLGKKLFFQALEKSKLQIKDLEIPLKKYLQEKNITENQFFIQLGRKQSLIPITISALLGNAQGNNQVLVINSALDSGIHFSDCCYPLPKEAVVGRYSQETGITVHRKDCEIAAANTIHEWLEVEWNSEIRGFFTSYILITVEDVSGVLAEISKTIAENGNNIKNILIDSNPEDEHLKLIHCWLEVHNVEELQNLLKKIRNISGIKQIDRI